MLASLQAFQENRRLLWAQYYGNRSVALIDKEFEAKKIWCLTKRFRGNRLEAATVAHSNAVIEHATWKEERDRDMENKPKVLDELERLERNALHVHLEGLDGEESTSQRTKKARTKSFVEEAEGSQSGCTRTQCAQSVAAQGEA